MTSGLALNLVNQVEKEIAAKEGNQ